MLASTLCPHCGLPAKPLAKAFFERNSTRRSCDHCGGLIINEGSGWWSWLSALWLLPSLFVHPWWARLIVLLVTLAALGGYRLSRCRYSVYKGPITFT